MSLKHIGKSYEMYDGVDKSKGNVKYICDMKLPNMLHAYLVTSTVAHANIISIDTSKAYIEGVVKIYTHENTPTKKFNSYRWIENLEAIDDERILNDKVRYYGDRVALVVASDAQTAKRAAKLIEIEYEELPTVLSIEAAKTDKVKLNEYSNKVAEGGFGAGNTLLKIAESDVVVRSTSYTPRISHSAMETHVALADYNEFENKLTVYSPSQISHAVQKGCAEITNLDLSNVRAVKTKMGGSFGGKTHPIPEQLAAYASVDLKQPVSLVFTRKQTFSSSRSRTASKGTIETGFTKDGKILARDIHMDFDSGGYFTNVETVCIAGGKKSFRLYEVDDQSYTYEAYLTNHTISGACRGYGSPQIHVLTETNINIAAKELGIDPVELRLKNLVKPYRDDPIKAPNLGNVRIIDALEKARELFKWDEKKTKYANHNDKRYHRGIGVAVASHGNGYFPAFPDYITVYMTINVEGEIEVKGAIHDQGCGTLTSMQQIVAETLDVEMKQVVMCEADTDVTPFDSAGTQACRVTHVVGRAMNTTAEKLKDKLLAEVNKLYECSDAKIENGKLIVNNKQLEIGEVIKELRTKLQFDPAVLHTFHSYANPASTAACFAEVEVDKYSGNVRIVEMVQVQDIGKVINRTLCEGQIHGGIQMGVGLALGEEIKYDENGKLLSQNFSRYEIFNSSQMPRIITDFIEGHEESGPFGAKSIGEISTIPSTPAVIAAVENAIGTFITDLPITPQKVYDAINKSN